jgi:hypothetical protein
MIEPMHPRVFRRGTPGVRRGAATVIDDVSVICYHEIA